MANYKAPLTPRRIMQLATEMANKDPNSLWHLGVWFGAASCMVVGEAGESTNSRGVTELFALSQSSTASFVVDSLERGNVDTEKFKQGLEQLQERLNTEIRENKESDPEND